MTTVKHSKCAVDHLPVFLTTTGLVRLNRPPSDIFISTHSSVLSQMILLVWLPICIARDFPGRPFLRIQTYCMEIRFWNFFLNRLFLSPSYKRWNLFLAFYFTCYLFNRNLLLKTKEHEQTCLLRMKHQHVSWLHLLWQLLDKEQL